MQHGVDMRFKWKLLLKVSKCNLNVAMPFNCSHHADVAGVGVRRGATKAPPSPRARRSQLRQEIAAQRALDSLGQEAEGRSNETEVYILVTLREFESSFKAMYVATTVPYASNESFECKSHAKRLSLLRVQLHLLHLPVRPSKRATVCTSSRRRSYRMWPWWTGLATRRSGADGSIDTPSCLLMCENL